MLSDPKVETKLMKIMSEFTGMVLRNARFKEIYANGRDIVVLELVFSYKFDANKTRTTVIAVDKQLTIEEHEDAVKEILEN